MNTDPFFVPTRSSLGKTVSYNTITFHKKVKDTGQDKDIVKEQNQATSNHVIDMKKARFEVYKFAQSALKGEDKQKSKIDLAIKLGAKPPKKQHKNYKLLKEEIKKDIEESEKKKELFNVPMKNRMSTYKSKLNKGTLKKKRKIGSGILNEYGKFTSKRHRGIHSKIPTTHSK